MLDLIAIMVYHICMIFERKGYMEPVILKNEYLTVRLSQKGAAIEEVLSSDDEILLVGGDTFSFPVCGAVSGGGAYLGKMHCKMPYGGFAKDKQFEVMEYMEDYAEFILTADDDTVKNYPFSFNLIITYKLLGNALEVGCTLGNFSEYKMPYSFGFGVCAKNIDAVEFENEEILEGYPLTGGIIRDPLQRLADGNGKILKIEEGGSCVMKNIISNSVKILSGDTGIKIYGSDLRNLALSTQNGVTTVGLWDGMADFAGEKSGFLNTETSDLLDENSTAERIYQLTFKK